MKKLIVAAALGVFAVGALAQGQFNFGNKNTISTPPIDARVFDGPGGNPLAGTAYWAQAYVKLVGAEDSSYAPVGSAVNFRTGNNTGYIVTGTVTTGFAGGTEVEVQMRAWAAAGGTSYEAARDGGFLYGFSNPVKLTVAVAPNLPQDMTGLQSFNLQIIPEPSTLALGLLGAAAFFLRRRS
jgi:hypothetical protein